MNVTDKIYKVFNKYYFHTNKTFLNQIDMANRTVVCKICNINSIVTDLDTCNYCNKYFCKDHLMEFDIEPISCGRCDYTSINVCRSNVCYDGFIESNVQLETKKLRSYLLYIHKKLWKYKYFTSPYNIFIEKYNLCI